MDRPYALFRRRRRPLQRLGQQVVWGAVLAVILIGIQRLVAAGEWVAVGPTAALAAVMAYQAYAAIRRLGGWIALYEDRIVWRDERGRRHETLPSSIVELEPDQHGQDCLVRVRGGKNLTLSPDFERTTELKLRLQDGNEFRHPIPFSREPWQGSSSYGPTAAAGGLGLLLVVMGVLFATGMMGDANLKYGALTAGILLLWGIRDILSFFFEGIEIEEDFLIHRSWVPGFSRRVPVGSILGAVQVKSAVRQTGVIDTDLGEIYFAMDFDGAENLIWEAQRLGTARYEQAKRLMAPARPSEEIKERTSTA